MKFKLISCLVIVGILAAPFTVAAQSTTSPLAILNDLERVLYGEAQSGALLQSGRRDRAGNFGSVQSGPVMTRIDHIDEYLSGDIQGTGLKLQLNLVEWGF